MKFGDVLEEFIFLVFKYQRRTKGIDYFQSADDEEQRDSKQNNGHDNLNDDVHLQVSPKAVKAKTIEQHYEMCTVVEESNEEEGEESPLNKKLPSPTKFLKGKNFDSPPSVTFSIDAKSPQDKEKTPSNEGLQKSPGLGLLSPLQVPCDDLPPDLGECMQRYISGHGQPQTAKEIAEPLMPRLKSQRESEEHVKIENLVITPPESIKELGPKDSKVNIIEKLESKIFKLLKDAKRQIERSKEKKKVAQIVSSIDAFKSTSNSREKKKGHQGRTGNASLEVSASPEKATAYHLINSNPFGLCLKTKKDTKNLPYKKAPTSSKVVSKSMVGMVPGPRSSNTREYEKNNISVSFNLDFSKLTTSQVIPKKSGGGQSHISHREVMNINTYLIPKRSSFSKSVKRNTVSPSHREAPDSKEGSVTDRSRQSYETPTKKNIKNHLKEHSNSKLKTLLEKIKSCKNTKEKEKQGLKPKTSAKRGSEGDIRTTTKFYHSHVASSNPFDKKPAKREIFSRGRIETSQTSAFRSSFRSFEQDSKTQSGLLKIKNKLVISVLQC